MWEICVRRFMHILMAAKHEGGDFLLRIEDTDQERFVEEALGIIYRTLEKTGLIHDEDLIRIRDTGRISKASVPHPDCI